MEHEKPRWEYRFDNYKRAFFLLREAINLRENDKLSDLEQEGIIQCFEYTWELAWKTLKDYLEHEGVTLDKITPKTVILASVEARIITQHEQWMQALEDRNKMNHVYNNSIFAKVVENIIQTYLPLFEQLYEKLFDELMQEQ